MGFQGTPELSLNTYRGAGEMTEVDTTVTPASP